MYDRLSLNPGKVVLVFTITIVIVLGSLARVAWATPMQDPDRQTVPTPTPSRPGWVDPVITKRGDPEEALPGEEVIFTLEVTNHGNQAVVDVVVVDVVPEYLEILQVTTTQGITSTVGQTVVVEVGVIGPEFVVEIVITTRVREGTPRPVDMENVALFRSPNGGERKSTPVPVHVPGTRLPETGGRGTYWIAAAMLSGALMALIIGLRLRKLVVEGSRASSQE